MKAGTRFSARVLIFSAISGLMLTNMYLLSAEEPSVQASLNKKQSIKTVRNPQNTLVNAIQREMKSARRISKPRALFPQNEKQNAPIQQVGLTLNPKSLFQNKSQSSRPKQTKRKSPEIVRGGKRSAPAQYQTAVPLPTSKTGLSQIQTQLESLYRRDGRKMPPMQLNKLPQTANNQSATGRGTLNSANSPQAGTSSQNLVGSSNRNRYRQPVDKKKWYDKFLPAKPKPSPKRLQQSHQIVRKAPVTPSENASPESLELPQLPAPKAQSVVSGTEQPIDKQETVAKSTDELEEEATEQFFIEQEIAAEKKVSTETPVTAEKTVEAAPENVVLKDEFQDLFPDMSEAAADNLNKPVVAKEKSPQNPFSGLALEEELLKSADKKQTQPSKSLEEETPQIAQEDTKNKINPFEPQAESQVDSEKSSKTLEFPIVEVVEKEKISSEKNSEKPQLKKILESQFVPPAKRKTASEHDSSIEKKLALIASRGNIKGLKGFCSVALRENRLLVDARPEFSSSYKSMNYQFASLENKLKFDREPAKYAPAAGGSDIVLLVDHQNDKEGTLDFASWYKGKLYLFSNKSNMDLFMKTPALYVGVE